MHLSEKTLSRNIIYEGKVFTIALDSVELEDGSTANRELVLHPAGAGCVLTEICAGKLEKGEDPESCAVRELSEELGLEAGRVISLGFMEATPAYDSERTYIYLALELKQVQRHPDEGEFIDIVKIPYEKALNLVHDGTLTDGKTQLALLKAERILRGKA